MCRISRRSRHRRHPVAQVGDAGGVDDAGQLELDVAPARCCEQRPPLAQEHRDQVDLELVEHARAQARLREVGAVDEHVASPAASLAWRIALSTPSVT